MSDTKVLLITSNGKGLGHLIRQLTIAAALPKDVPYAIFTLSQGATVAASNNLEYAPSYTQPWITKGKWHGGYLRDRILLMIEEFQPSVLVFDGVVPYPGLLDAISRSNVATVWMRRGLWQKATNPKPLRDSHWFDLILEPGDIGDALDVGPTAGRTDATKIGVVSDSNPATALNRDDAALALGINPKQKTILFNLGSSTIEGGLAPIAAVLNDFPDWQVITTKDELGRSKGFTNSNQVHTLQGIFPLHPYLAAVDLAITSAGYNAAHEFVGMSVPAIYVAAPSITDDQVARAKAIAAADAGWVVLQQTSVEIAKTLREVLENATAELAQKRNSCSSLRSAWDNGAQTAAELILQAQHQPHSDQLALIRLKFRIQFEFYLGNLVRGIRQPKYSNVNTSRNLTTELINSEIPLEHILPTASSAYESKRIALTNKWLKG
jgi:nitrogen fixation protein FixH